MVVEKCTLDLHTRFKITTSNEFHHNFLLPLNSQKIKRTYLKLKLLCENLHK